MVFLALEASTSLDYLKNVDNLRESMRLATSINWNDIDLSHYPCMYFWMLVLAIDVYSVDPKNTIRFLLKK